MGATYVTTGPQNSECASLSFINKHCLAGCATLGEPCIKFSWFYSRVNRENICIHWLDWWLGVLKKEKPSWPNVSNIHLCFGPKESQNGFDRGVQNILPSFRVNQLRINFDLNGDRCVGGYLSIIWVTSDHRFHPQLDQPNLDQGMISHGVDHLDNLSLLGIRGRKVRVLIHHNSSMGPRAQCIFRGDDWFQLLMGGYRNSFNQGL